MANNKDSDKNKKTDDITQTPDNEVIQQTEILDNKSIRKKKNKKKYMEKFKLPNVKIIKYFSDTILELKKVVWPTIKQVQNGVIVVLVMLFLIGSAVSVLDFGFSFGMKSLISLRSVPDNSTTN